MRLEKHQLLGLGPGLFVQFGVEVIVPSEYEWNFTFTCTVYLIFDITDIFLSLTD